MSLRSRFLRGLKEQVRKGTLKFKEPTPDNIIVVTLAKDFNAKSDASVFLVPINRSEPRNLDCGRCHEQVVMSNGMYSKLLAGQITAANIRCVGCVQAMVAEEAAEPPKP